MASTLSGSTVQFTWAAATGEPVSRYWLYTSCSAPDQPCPAGQQCSYSDGWDPSASSKLGIMPTGTHTSWTKNGLPIDGSTIYGGAGPASSGAWLAISGAIHLLGGVYMLGLISVIVIVANGLIIGAFWQARATPNRRWPRPPVAMTVRQGRD